MHRFTWTVRSAVLTISLATGVALASLACPALAASADTTADPSPYWVTADSAVVRAQPERTAAAVGVAYHGDRLTYHELRQSPDGYAWWHMTVVRTGVDGWIRGDLIHTPEQDTPTRLT